MMREGRNFNPYFIDAMIMQNQLYAFEEISIDKILINIMLNGLQKSYEMVIQDMTYLTNQSFKAVMKNLLTKI